MPVAFDASLDPAAGSLTAATGVSISGHILDNRQLALFALSNRFAAAHRRRMCGVGDAR
jgi:hypothetical protein